MAESDIGCVRIPPLAILVGRPFADFLRLDPQLSWGPVARGSGAEPPGTAIQGLHGSLKTSKSCIRRDALGDIPGHRRTTFAL